MSYIVYCPFLVKFCYMLNHDMYTTIKNIFNFQKMKLKQECHYNHFCRTEIRTEILLQFKIYEILTFHAKHEHDQLQGECLGQYYTTCGPISLLGQKHHNAPTISLATRLPCRSFPICLQFSQNAKAHAPATKFKTCINRAQFICNIQLYIANFISYGLSNIRQI